MNENITIKQLSAELHVSEQALRQWCKKNNIRKERTQGTKAVYCFDFDTLKQIRNYYCHGIIDESKETKEHNKSNESKESTNQSVIDELRAQIAELKADKDFLKSQLTAKDETIKQLTAEREQERKERQTILAELLSLRGQKKIEVKAQSEPRPTGAATRQEPKAQKRKLSLIDKLRAAADIFKR